MKFLSWLGAFIGTAGLIACFTLWCLVLLEYMRIQWADVGMLLMMVSIPVAFAGWYGISESRQRHDG